jgi:Ca2+-transporting ATPase
MANDGWHLLPPDEVARGLQTSLAAGLTDEAAAERKLRDGPNELADRQHRRPLAIFVDQLTGTMVLVLIAAGAVSLFLGDIKDAVAIAAIVALNAVLGFTQEYRAEQALAALKRLAAPHVRVRRNGRLQDVASPDLVAGDVMVLEAGNVLAADGRVVESANLRAHEASLTGESEPVQKSPETLPAGARAVADRSNMVFMGTVISAGRGTAIVTATGMRTELGAIAASLQSVEREPTPLQRRLDALGRWLAAAALTIVAVIFTLGILRGEDVTLIFLTAVSMAVAAVPEGLPAVVTIALALGAQRMLRRRALIRTLSAVETLGSVTVICSDKTGTLTENRMRATVLDTIDARVELDGDGELPQPSGAVTLLLTAAALCNDAVEAGTGAPGVVGDPTEVALMTAAARFGLRKDDLERQFPRVAEIAFDADRKRMTTLHTGAEVTVSPIRPALDAAARAAGLPGSPERVAFSKGAVEPLLDICTHAWADGAMPRLDGEQRARIAAAHDRLAETGMRVLGIAFRAIGGEPAIDDLERDLIFVGVVGIIDPPRAEVAAAVATCVAAGIRPVMITGDHPLTARHIAGQLGIVNDPVMTGTELDAVPPGSLAKVVARTSVYARVSPAHKLRIVEALQRRGEIVAMTGDGVNDAPALKRADIGVAMGVTGTDVSKEAADAVLLDDDFATIVAAVEEGRIIYDNIRRFVKYLLTTNSAELWLMVVAPFLGMPLPLLPLQILWINLVTDGPTALTLGVEPAERNVMRRPPRSPTDSLFADGLGRHVVWVGALMGALTLGLGYVYWSTGNPRWQTVVFTALALAQMAHVVAIRSHTDSVFRIGLFSNRPLAGAVTCTILLQLALLYVGWAGEIFGTEPLRATELMSCVVVGAVVFAAVEFDKVLARRSQAGRGLH